MQIRCSILAAWGLKGRSPGRTATRTRREYALGYLGTPDRPGLWRQSGLGHKSCPTEECYAIGDLQDGTRAKAN